MAKSKSTAESDNFSATNPSYISCIRIHGLRILPPLLTEEKRKRMKYYKELALKVEENIKNKQLNKHNSDSSDDSQPVTYSSSSMSDSVNYSSDEEPTYKSQIFSESCRSDVIKMLNDSPKTAITNVPLINNEESDTNKCLNEIITDLPEKIPTENNLIHNSEPQKLVSEKIVAENDKNSSILSETDSNLSHNSGNTTPPLLIRSNSYTLDSPSPYLLAFMKEKHSFSPDSQKTSENGRKRRTWDLEKAREKWSSIEHDLNIVADKTMGKRNDNTLTSATSSEIKIFDPVQLPEKDVPTSEHSRQTKRATTAPPKISERFVKNFVSPLRPTVPVKDTPKKNLSPTLQRQTTLQRQKKISNDDVPKKEIVLPKKPNILSCKKSEQQIREVIEKIHNEQSKQMSDLIARQKKEQETLMKLFAEQQAVLLSKLRGTCETNEELNKTEPEPDIIKNSENLLYECKKLLHQETISESSSQTLFSPPLSTPEDTFTNDTLKSLTPSPKELIIESVNSNSSRFNNSFSTDSLEPIYSKTKLKRSSSCSRQLFPTQKQIWAANKINAFARGYLIRRLIKTDRVQDLIKTIRDTLVCAMELHHETADKIQPADVELHRRLIQQVTAACYTFHDTFFELSRSDQLCIIAVDRDRQKEKLSRPISARSNASLSSTTQRVLERKLRRSLDSVSIAPSRSSSSRSCYSANEFRMRAKSLGLSDSMQSDKKTSPQNDVMRRAMSYGANKKPWR